MKLGIYDYFIYLFICFSVYLCVQLSLCVLDTCVLLFTSWRPEEGVGYLTPSLSSYSFEKQGLSLNLELCLSGYLLAAVTGVRNAGFLRGCWGLNSSPKDCAGSTLSRCTLSPAPALWLLCLESLVFLIVCKDLIFSEQFWLEVCLVK